MIFNKFSLVRPPFSVPKGTQIIILFIVHVTNTLYREKFIFFLSIPPSTATNYFNHD